jgi:hypothetical protein
MRPAENIKKLIKNIRIRTNPEVNKAVLNDLFNILDKAESVNLDVKQPSIWRIIMKSRITKLAAVAVIIMAVMLITYLGNGTLDITTAAFAQMTEAMKKMPWMHMITEIRDRPSYESGEYWYSFDLGIEAIRYDSGKLSFYDYGARAAYVYDPSSEEVTISRLPEKRLLAGGAGSPWHFLENTVELLAENEEAEVTHKVSQYEGNDVEIYKVRVPRGTPTGSLGTEEWIFTADNKTHLIMSLKLQGYDPNGNFIEVFEATFNYPDNGPSDIYEIGAPMSAELIDNRTGPG